MLLSHFLLSLILISPVLGKLDLSNIGECDGKVVMKAERLCKYGIDPEKFLSLLAHCCSTHCSKAFLKVFCKLKAHHP